MGGGADELAGAGRAALARPRLPPSAPVAPRCGPRLPHVYPVYRAGLGGDLSALDALGRRPARAAHASAGRACSCHDNTHHALAMGWAAADALRPTAPSTSRLGRRPRSASPSHVVED